MTRSKKILAQLDKLDVVAWFSVSVPMFGLTRDACYRDVECEGMNQNGSLLLVAARLNVVDEALDANDELNIEKAIRHSESKHKAISHSVDHNISIVFLISR